MLENNNSILYGNEIIDNLVEDNIYVYQKNKYNKFMLKKLDNYLVCICIDDNDKNNQYLVINNQEVEGSNVEDTIKKILDYNYDYKSKYGLANENFFIYESDKGIVDIEIDDFKSKLDEKVFCIEIKETSSVSTYVRSNTVYDAINIVEDKYREEEIVLEVDDFDEYEIEPYYEGERSIIRAKKEKELQR